jgi:hypothetical protein
MIFDQENMFFDNAITGGNVIANVGGGDAHDPLFLVVAATTALTAGTGGATAALETSDAEDFATKETLGTYTLAASTKGLLVRAKVPYGMKKYVRLTLTGVTAGAITAGLTETVPNWP